MNLSVREWKKNDIESIVDYFVKSDAEFLEGMGANKSKLPKKQDWIKKLNREFNKPNEQRDFYYIIWLLVDKPIGHSNINNIDFGNSATMHLHLWNRENRRKGFGIELIKQTIPYYFNYFKLKKLVCEPMAKNTALQIEYNWQEDKNIDSFSN